VANFHQLGGHVAVHWAPFFVHHAKIVPQNPLSTANPGKQLSLARPLILSLDWTHDSLHFSRSLSTLLLFQILALLNNYPLCNLAKLI
jgi:hypothetical protein